MAAKVQQSDSALTCFTNGVWLATEPVRIVGMRLTSTMTVVQLPDSRVLLYSPIPMTQALRAAVQALGTVTHVYAPNTYHHMWIGEWAQAFPNAYIHAPSALRTKRPDLRIDRAHDREPLGEFGDVLDEIHIDGFALEETVLVHRPSKTLLVADLVHNVGRPAHRWTALYASMMGFYDRVAISRLIRWSAFRDSAAARHSLRRLAACTFDRLIVGHGAPIEEGARRAVLGAYEWLGSGVRLPSAQPPRRGWCG